MSVQSYDPNAKLPVSFSDEAKAHLKMQIIHSEAKGLFFRLKEAGCSGYKYLLELAESEPENSLVYDIDGQFKLFVEQDVVPLIRGTIVDYVTEGVNRQLKFSNPNATGTCGCGESFSVNSEAEM